MYQTQSEKSSTPLFFTSHIRQGMETNPQDVGLPCDFGKHREVNHTQNSKTHSISISRERKLLAQVGPVLSTFCPRFPVTSEYQVKHHSKPVTCLAFDPSGSRLFTGSSDCSVKYWNFAAMKIEQTTPDVSIELDMACEITSIDYNGKLVLAASQTPEIGLYDLAGLKKGSTRRGDMYLYDISKTYGHVAPVNDAAFSKTDPNQFVSCSSDGTVRFWDVRKLNEQRWLFKLGERAGPRVPARSLVWSDENVLACGDDGLIYILERDQMQRKFAVGEPVRALDAFGDLVASRCQNRFFIWDLRNLSNSLAVFDCSSDVESVSFSPDGKTIMVPEMVNRRSIFGGCLRFVDLENREEVDRVMFTAGVGAKCCKWHRETNQIAVGCSDGITRVLFDFASSKKGVLLSLEKGVCIRTETDEAVIGNITPRLVDPETERVITVGGTGFWFPYTDAEKRDKRAAQQPKAPLWGEGHHGQIATHPRQVQLRELQQVDEPDDTDIVESLRARDKEAQVKYFTSVKDRRPE